MILPFILINSLTIIYANKDFHALVVNLKDETFELAKPVVLWSYDNYLKPIYAKDSDQYAENLFYACPINDNGKTLIDVNPLYIKIIKTDQISKRLTCKFPIRSTIEESQRENSPSKKYLVGFQIFKCTNAGIELMANASVPFCFRKVAIQQLMKGVQPEDFYFLQLTKIIFDPSKLSVRSVSYYFTNVPPFFRKKPIIDSLHVLWYKNKTIYDNQDIDIYYEPQNQISMLKDILGKTTAEKKFQEYGCLLKKSLVSYYDFYGLVWDQVVFHNANTAPMWKILEPDWTLLEKLTRDVSENLNKVHIETGTGWPLQMGKQSLYLNDKLDQIPIPAFFWKTIVNVSLTGQFQHQGVILIMHNLPNHPQDTHLCPDVSQENHWPPRFIETFTGKAHIYSCHLTANNADSIAIPIESEFRNAGPFDLKQVLIDNADQVRPLNLYDILASTNVYGYYQVKD